MWIGHNHTWGIKSCTYTTMQMAKITLIYQAIYPSLLAANRFHFEDGGITFIFSNKLHIFFSMKTYHTA